MEALMANLDNKPIQFGSSSLSPDVIAAFTGNPISQPSTPQVQPEQPQTVAPLYSQQELDNAVNPQMTQASALDLISQLGSASGNGGGFGFGGSSEPIMYEASRNTNMIAALNNPRVWNNVTDPIARQHIQSASTIGNEGARILGVALQENLLNEANDSRMLNEQYSQTLDDYFDSFGYKLSKYVPVIGPALNALSGNVARYNDKLTAIQEKIKVDKEKMANDTIAFGAAQKLAAGVDEFSEQRATELQSRLKAQREVTKVAAIRGGSSRGGGSGVTNKPWVADNVNNIVKLSNAEPILKLNNNALRTNVNYNSAVDSSKLTTAFGVSGNTVEANANNDNTTKFIENFMKQAVETNGEKSEPLLQSIASKGRLTNSDSFNIGNYIAANNSFDVSDYSKANRRGKVAQAAKDIFVGKVATAIQSIPAEQYNAINTAFEKENGRPMVRGNLDDAALLLRIASGNEPLHKAIVDNALQNTDFNELYRQSVNEAAGTQYQWNVTNDYTLEQAAKLASLGRNEAAIVKYAKMEYDSNEAKIAANPQIKSTDGTARKASHTPLAVYLIGDAKKALAGTHPKAKLNEQQYSRFSNVLFSQRDLMEFGNRMREESSLDDLRTQTVQAFIPNEVVLRNVATEFDKVYKAANQIKY